MPSSKHISIVLAISEYLKILKFLRKTFFFGDDYYKVEFWYLKAL